MLPIARRRMVRMTITSFLAGNMFAYPFMWKSLIAIVCLGIALPLMGLNMTTKRFSMIGDALSHTSLLGVALGLLCGILPAGMAVLVSIVCGVVIELIRSRFNRYAELALAIVMSISVGLAGILTKFVSANSFASYLFGSVSLVTLNDIYAIVPVSVLVVVFSVIFYRANMYASFNPYEARISGLKVRLLAMADTVLTAAVVALSSTIIGSLVVSSLLVIPVATALQLCRSYKGVTIIGILVSLLSGVLGLVLSFPWGTNSGSTIIVVATVFLILAIVYRQLMKLKLRLSLRSRKGVDKR
ncbi:MAG TPA: metal ABC transporter permease [Firmicutes bacterium]|nr:metal ABC transporter permease [Bacillota bacterium]